jgi:hypothetical protein
MQKSESINEIATALAKAQSKMALAERDTVNPFFNKSYADLASVWEACRAPLTENGLSVVQFPSAEGNVVTVDTMLIHTSGQWFSSTLSVVSKKDDAQGIGSSITYLRRYSLQSMVGVAPDDDDGNASVGGPPPEQAKRPSKKRDEPADMPPPLSAEDAKYIADASESIIAAATEDDLRAIGEIIKTKSSAIKNALRGIYQARLAVLETPSEATKSEASAA